MSAQSETVRAAIQFLTEHGPTHYKEIAKALLEGKLVTPRGKDPVYTIYADCFYAVQRGQQTDLYMAGRGVFALKSVHGDSVQGSQYAPERSASKPRELTNEELIAEYRRLQALCVERGLIVLKAKKTAETPAKATAAS